MARAPGPAPPVYAPPAPVAPTTHASQAVPPLATTVPLATLPPPAAPASASVSTPMGTGAGDVLLSPLEWVPANICGQAFDVADLVFRRNKQMKQHVYNITVEADANYARISFRQHAEAVSFVHYWRTTPRKHVNYNGVHAYIPQ